MKKSMKDAAYTTKHDSRKAYDLICFSHLRGDFVFQRPQHLMSRFAKDRRVFFIEEPVFVDGEPALDVDQRSEGLYIVKPQFRHGTGSAEIESSLRRMLDELVSRYSIRSHTSWYYTPMMLGWSRHLEPRAVVYDCMDELSAFRGAPAEMVSREAELFDLADLVFTGGRSLYEAKRAQHPSVFCFPSSIDAAHFGRARNSDGPQRPDQQAIHHPRIGFFGVIDERTDLALLEKIAQFRPEYNFVMIGPVVKIDEADLPRRNNIHYLGGKKYDELPDYISGWDAAMMPFALNESTRFISPTKTPEYLAAGRPVVSTPIRDVVRPYGEAGIVHIAESPEEFVAALDKALSERTAGWLDRVDEFLSGMSWDNTYMSMSELIDDVVASRPRERTAAMV